VKGGGDGGRVKKFKRQNGHDDSRHKLDDNINLFRTTLLHRKTKREGVMRA